MHLPLPIEVPACMPLTTCSYAVKCSLLNPGAFDEPSGREALSVIFYNDDEAAFDLAKRAMVLMMTHSDDENWEPFREDSGDWIVMLRYAAQYSDRIAYACRLLDMGIYSMA